MRDNITCRLCGITVATVRIVNTVHWVICPRCGEYSISDEAQDDWEQHWLGNLTPRAKANIAGWLREHQGSQILSDALEGLLTHQTPPVEERANRFLLELERRTPELGGGVPVQFIEPLAFDFMGLSWSKTTGELAYLVRIFLEREKGFVQGLGGNPPNHYAITPKGYAHLESLRQVNRDSAIGFCAMWFAAEMEQIWLDGIAPAIEAAGYESTRIDRHEHNNRIDDEIIAMLRRSRFVVADFTGQRGGVYFEAGYALGLGLPVVWIVDEADLPNVHFDNRQYNFIPWNRARLDELRSRLQNRIEATIGRGPRR